MRHEQERTFKVMKPHQNKHIFLVTISVLLFPLTPQELGKLQAVAVKFQ